MAAQIGFSPDGRQLVVTLRGVPSTVGAIDTFAVNPNGSLTLEQADRTASVDANPFGFAFTRSGTLLVSNVGQVSGTFAYPGGSLPIPQILDPAQFTGDQADRVRPGQRHELVAATPLPVAGRLVQPAAPDGGLAYPAVGGQRVRYRGEQRRRVRVGGKRLDPGQLPAGRAGLEGPPVGAVADPGAVRWGAHRAACAGAAHWLNSMGRSLSHMPSGRTPKCASR